MGKRNNTKDFLSFRVYKIIYDYFSNQDSLPYISILLLISACITLFIIYVYFETCDSNNKDYTKIFWTMVLAKRRYSFICIKCSFRLGILRYCINRAEQKNDKNIADSKKRNEEINKTIVVIDKVSIKQ